MLIGAQLYTVRAHTQTESEFDATIKKIKDIGYSAVQVSGVGPFSAGFIRSACDKYGIDVVITHTAPDRVLNDTDNVIKEHNVLGAGYVGIGGMPNEYRANVAGIQKFIDDFTPAAQKIAGAGMTFMYHNHHFEFEKYYGKTIFDRITDGFAANLAGVTLDTYWVQAGGGDSAYYLKKLKGRVDTIHFKDMVITKNPNGGVQQTMAPILEGNLNWPAIFDACETAGVKYAFIEIDDCGGADPFEWLKISYDNLRKHGYK